MKRTISYRVIDGLRSCRRLMPAAASFALLALVSATASPAAAAGEPTANASYRPLQCSKAVSPSELAICRSYPLGQAEARMATLFGIATSLVAMGQRADIEEAQRQWLHARDACGKDTVCLLRSYQSRIDELSAVTGSIASRGPF
jgi:uncharacterized protein